MFGGPNVDSIPICPSGNYIATPKKMPKHVSRMVYEYT